MPKITDPDSLTISITGSGLGVTSDIYLNTSNLTIAMATGFAIDSDGVSMQAVYSFIKEAILSRIKYVFSTGTSGTGLPAGNIRLNNANPAAVTTVFIDETNASGRPAVNWLDTLTTGSRIRVFLSSAPSTFAEYIVASSITDVGAYRSVPVTYVAHSGTITNTQNIHLSIPSSFPAFPLSVEAISAAAGIYELRNGWNWANNTTRNLIKDGGWTLFNSSNSTVLERWMNVKSLGSIHSPSTDQPYYWQTDTNNATTTNTTNPGTVNQAIQIFGGVSNGNLDFRNFFKIALRESGKVFAEYDLLTEQAITQLQAQSYAFPLSNSLDSKSTVIDTGIDANSDNTADVVPYNGMTITYLVGSGFQPWANTVAYAANTVVSSAGRWFTTTLGGTSSGSSVANDGGVIWAPYTGERLVGVTYHAYNIIVGANNGTKGQVYDFLQWSLRRTGDIDAGTGTRSGRVANLLSTFSGDRLVTRLGVYIDNWLAADVNNINSEITYTDTGNVGRTPPNPSFISQGAIQFNSNLVNDVAARFWVYFSNASASVGDEWGTSGAIIVNNNSGLPLTDSINGRASIPITFGYDVNTQGGRTPGTDAAVTVVAIGAELAQYVTVTGTITRSVTNNISLSAATERNYLDAI